MVPLYSGCDSEIEFPLDGGCKRQFAKLSFELKGICVFASFCVNFGFVCDRLPLGVSLTQL